VESVARVAPRPLLIMHGEEDDVVSPDDARVLYARAHEPKELVMLPKTGHRFRSESVAIERALDWLGEHLGLAGR
jgi:putative redox protein